ncbi:MAG: 4-alpha-glucanotransferase [Clostridia bacterium]|nr:4-alpha-glucanotransferase [Clostridia bacterium]
MIARRRAGALMSVSSLPSPYGIGVFGEEAKDWIDRLADMGFSVWQVLPFNMLDLGKSPYGSCSAFAGNYLYIDPRGLVKAGFVSAADAKSCEYDGSPYTTDYAFAERAREQLLRKAFTSHREKANKLAVEFAKKYEWASDFALFMAVKEANDGRPWWEWPKRSADHEQCKQDADQYADETAYQLFVQAVFFEQWEEIHAYAQKRGVLVLGDMPLYVAMDSADVWSCRRFFCLNERDFRPDKVAGVPPDYFSKDGQLWGNPLYNWKTLKADGYSWWIGRVKAMLSLYDGIRIDHFRALVSYWAVPSTAKTAKEGAWEVGPRQDLFDVLEKTLGPDLPIIAEDLGTFGEDVVRLLETSGIPGMHVIQFGFDPHGDSTHLPHNYTANSVAYVGTHDNNTLLGWLWEASEEERRFALDYCGFHGDNWGDGGYHSASCRTVIETVWKSASRLAVIPFQDMCGFGSDARMNIPGVPEKNWRFRTTKETMDQMDKAYYRHINRVFRRG